jgi:hypothetical protein
MRETSRIPLRYASCCIDREADRGRNRSEIRIFEPAQRGGASGPSDGDPFDFQQGSVSFLQRVFGWGYGRKGDGVLGNPRHHAGRVLPQQNNLFGSFNHVLPKFIVVAMVLKRWMESALSAIATSRAMKNRGFCCFRLYQPVIRAVLHRYQFSMASFRAGYPFSALAAIEANISFIGLSFIASTPCWKAARGSGNRSLFPSCFVPTGSPLSACCAITSIRASAKRDASRY